MDVITRFAKSLNSADPSYLDRVREYAAWYRARHQTPFTPATADDVDLRTYLLELRLGGAGRTTLKKHLAALRHFYAWAETTGVIESSPFDEYDFDRPFLTRDQIRRRQDAAPRAQPHEREIARLRALNRLAEHLNRTTDLQSTLNITLETLTVIMGLPTAWIFLWEPHQPPNPHDFTLDAACGLPPGLEYRQRMFLCDPPDCHCQSLLRDGLLTRAVNVVECTRLQDALEEGTDNRGLLFHATVPLLADGRVFGILNVATEEWQFLSAADLQLLSAVGAQVGVAVERARLFARRAELGAVEERNRLAREIHDTLAQGLAAIALQLETADALLEANAEVARTRPAVQNALALTRANLEEARRSVLDLRAQPLEGRTLVEALTALTAEREWATRWHTPIQLTVTGAHPPLPGRVEVGLYRIAREALTNAARHAQARHIAVQLQFTPQQVHLIITDDGTGFDPVQLPPGRYGLIGLNERAKLLGGTLTLESSPGQGTRVEVSVAL